MATAPPSSQQAANELAEQLLVLPSVGAATVERDRYPPQVTIDLTTPTIQPGVHDVLDAFGSTIEDTEAKVDTSGEVPGLRLFVTAGEAWKDAGNRTLRSQGSSLVVNIPPEAIDASGLQAEETLDIHARSGELHIKSHEDGPRFP